MTKPLPFTAAGLARAIKGARQAGMFVIGVRPDGSLILGDKPVESDTFAPPASDNAPVSKWETQGA